MYFRFTVVNLDFDFRLSAMSVLLLLSLKSSTMWSEIFDFRQESSKVSIHLRFTVCQSTSGLRFFFFSATHILLYPNKYKKTNFIVSSADIIFVLAIQHRCTNNVVLDTLLTYFPYILDRIHV